jgi:uncharacterized protein (DUF2062 family)
MHPRLRRFIPTRERIHENRWLRWLGPHLLHPRLWHFSRRGVSVGVGLGVFFGLLIPIAQIPFAAGAAVLLRANVPVAIGSTLVTNPVTFAPIYVLAHQVGAMLLGEVDAEAPDFSAPPKPAVKPEANWLQKTWASMLAIGRPLLLGLSLFAVVAGILTYALIMLGWRIKTTLAWKRRKRKLANIA